jgi:hypothetical protein
MEPEVLITREEMKTLMWLMVDIVTELKKIRRLLANGEEEEQGLE